MAKTSNLYARIEPDVKEQAEGILSALGIPVSNAINMFYKQIILHRGIPFDVKLPIEKPIGLASMTIEEIDEELEKGYMDILEGNVKPARQAFADVRRDFNL